MRRVIRKLMGKTRVGIAVVAEVLESGVAINPFSSTLRSDPYSVYRKLRDKSPVHRSRITKAWVLTRFVDVDTVLRDYKRFSNDDRNANHVEFAPDVDEARSMLRLDDPDHNRIRNTVGKAFTHRSVSELRPRINEVADQLLDGLGDSFDALGELACPLPLTIISELVGVPREDLAKFQKWGAEAGGLLMPSVDGESVRQSKYARLRFEQAAYFDDLVDQRRSQPREDLISDLLTFTNETDRLTRDELVSMAMLLMAAGTLTTQNLIGNGLYALLKNPDQLRLLKERPMLMESAIEEFLRFDSPSQFDWRTALEDVEIGSKKIKKGDVLILGIGAANRDPAQFQEPDRLDIERPKINHVSFGRGIHNCIGAPLARVQAQVVFQKLLERFPEIGLDVEPEFTDHIVFRGLKSLNVSVRRAPISLSKDHSYSNQREATVSLK